MELYSQSIFPVRCFYFTERKLGSLGFFTLVMALHSRHIICKLGIRLVLIVWESYLFLFFVKWKWKFFILVLWEFRTSSSIVSSCSAISIERRPSFPPNDLSSCWRPISISSASASYSSWAAALFIISSARWRRCSSHTFPRILYGNVFPPPGQMWMWLWKIQQWMITISVPRAIHFSFRVHFQIW